MLKGRHQRTKEHNFNFFWWSVVSQAKIWLNLFIIPNQLHCKVVLPVLKTVCYETVASLLFTVTSFSADQVAISSEGIIESFLFFQWMYASTEWRKNNFLSYYWNLYNHYRICNIYSKKCVQYILQNTKRIRNFVFYVDDLDYFVVWLFWKRKTESEW